MASMKLCTSLAVLVVAGFVAGCGGGESAGEQTTDPQQAFLQSMVPHHNSAVDMAKVAETEGQSAFVKDLASEITRTQTEEVGRMEEIHQRLFNAPLKPDMGAHAALGLSAQEAGMNHMDGAKMIRGKQPFDRAFVDEMIPHHQGATRMAEAVLPKTRDRQLRSLAEGIIAAQKREIAEMQRFREREFAQLAPVALASARRARPAR
ncbi:MAG: DUF305 domain-containing protein [Thermoleophilaceae bacterium]